MKKVLITGANSFIGVSFEKYMEKFNGYIIETLDMRGENWKSYDFSTYDSVFHVAGIAHADVGNVDEATKKLYYQVNCDLAFQVAEKYKKERPDNSGQFIYMSSIIIYGIESNIRKKRVITPDTNPNPTNFYGDSKLQAEIKIKPLQNGKFNVVILRPPMIYGPGGKGNYETLKKIALKVPFFPDIKNERSMLSIDVLSAFIKDRIDKNDYGIFFPQNSDYVRTSYMVRDIAKESGKNVRLFSWMNWSVYLLGFFPGKIGKVVNKAFGSLVYSREGID